MPAYRAGQRKDRPRNCSTHLPTFAHISWQPGVHHESACSLKCLNFPEFAALGAASAPRGQQADSVGFVPARWCGWVYTSPTSSQCVRKIVFWPKVGCDSIPANRRMERAANFHSRPICERSSRLSGKSSGRLSASGRMSSLGYSFKRMQPYQGLSRSLAQGLQRRRRTRPVGPRLSSHRGP
jgi:hypothetical protein